MDNLNRNLNKITLVLLVMASLLLVVLIGLINNTVRLSIYSRRFLIHTMKLVGASWSFIRRPFMMRSLCIALISALLADGVLLAGVHSALTYDAALRQFIPNESLLLMGLSVFVLGILIMLLCTYLSVTHLLRKKIEY